jgi:hypothetical protein
VLDPSIELSRLRLHSREILTPRANHPHNSDEIDTGRVSGSELAQATLALFTTLLQMTLRNNTDSKINIWWCPQNGEAIDILSFTRNMTVRSGIARTSILDFTPHPCPASKTNLPVLFCIGGPVPHST